MALYNENASLEDGFAGTALEGRCRTEIGEKNGKRKFYAARGGRV